MLNISGKNILLTKGNTGIIEIELYKDGEHYTLKSSEYITFNVRRNNDFNTIVMTKRLDSNLLVLIPSDTISLSFGEYDYDFTFYGTDIVDTFITGKFIIGGASYDYD